MVDLNILKTDVDSLLAMNWDGKCFTEVGDTMW